MWDSWLRVLWANWMLREKTTQDGIESILSSLKMDIEAVYSWKTKYGEQQISEDRLIESCRPRIDPRSEWYKSILSETKQNTFFRIHLSEGNT